MSTPSIEIAATWTHTTAEATQRSLDLSRTATPEERAALAAALDIPGVEKLQVRYKIVPLAAGRFRLTGTVDARVVQACVVTLEPVETAIRGSIDVNFWPAADLARAPPPTEEEQPILDAEEHEPIEDHRIAVGRIVQETLAAALPPFPRAPGAELDRHEAGPADGGTPSPFAALAKWKPKPE